MLSRSPIAPMFLVLTALLLVVSVPVAADAGAQLATPDTSGSSASSAAVEVPVAPSSEWEQGFLYETEAIDLVDVGAAYICAEGCTVGGFYEEIECSHLDCGNYEAVCMGGDGSPCSGSCVCC